jgi:hypothetical protein
MTPRTTGLRRPLNRNPWRELPAEVAKVLRPRIDGIAAEMIEVIRREVPSYRRPLNTEMGRDLVTAVHRALYQFVELIEDPDRSQDHNVTLFRRLGKREFLAGRSMDALQAAYRVGARVACRRYTEVAQAAALPIDTVLLLSETVLVQINALANESVRGYTEAQARSAGDLNRRRRALAERLLERSPDPGGASTEFLAFQAEWPLPGTIACLSVETGDEAEPFDGARLDEDILVLSHTSETDLLVPEPDNPCRLGHLREVVRGRLAVLGPSLPTQQAWLSRYCARLALRQARRGLLDGTELVVAEHHLDDLILLSGEQIGGLLAERTLGKLATLSAGKASRLEETMHALLASWGRTAPEVASALGIHPQTARNRLRQLEELLGTKMTDPDFRFAAELVLRIRKLQRARNQAHDAPHRHNEYAAAANGGRGQI